jgi:hypothetical protein
MIELGGKVSENTRGLVGDLIGAKNTGVTLSHVKCNCLFRLGCPQWAGALHKYMVGRSCLSKS